MVLLYAAIALLAIWGFRFRKPADPSAALSIEQSTMAKGLFVLLVFASHVSQYLDLPAGVLSWSYEFIRSNLGQLIVVPFLFFSGYGIRSSLMRKGDEYLRSMPKKRLLRTYVHTAVILLVFLAVQLFLGNRFPFRRILLGFVLLDSFGNSTWYLFAILYLYAITWLSFRLARTQKQAILLCFLFSVAYYIGLYLWKERYWYDTVFVYFLGLVLPDLQKGIDKCTGRTSGWVIGCVGLTAAVLILTKLPFPHGIAGIAGNLRAVCFMLLILIFLSRFQFGNFVLDWLGKHVFLCYMLQRLPMILLEHFDVSRTCIPLFVIGSAAGTVLLVLLIDPVIKCIDRFVVRA